jgi:hypothetical protein
MYSFEEIKSFIVDKTGCEENEVTSNCDLMDDLGCSGDDFDELIDDYAKRYKVNMGNYLWYFHTDEEGHSNSIGRVFFKAPYERVKHIPVTPTLLLESANEGKWLLTYPEHKLPKRRYDISINQVMVLLIIIFVIYKCAK